MFNDKQRQEYEDNAVEVVKDVYSNIAGDRTITYTIPDDIYSHWDMTVTVNGVDYKVENKCRPNYHYNDFDTYYIDANKGDLDLFNMIFPKDGVVAVTTQKILKEFTPKECKIKRLVYCDNESPEGTIQNYVIPRNKWWIYQLKPFKIINKPTK